MTEVAFKNVTKTFGDVVAVNNLNLKVRDKDFFILLGPSGCGKTTTLRLVAGLEKPTSGNVYIGDRIVNDVPPKDRNVAMVFQSYALYSHMRVYDNLAFPLRARKMSKEEIDRRVREVATMLKIEDLLHRKPGQLSGGQAQRVALGRALVRDPEVFLMDEPLSNLDAKLRVQMRAELQRLHRRLRVTTIYVTHDQAEAMTIGRTIALMKEGSLEQVGTPEEVYRRPKNIFAAGFIGSPSMNMLEGSIVEKDGGMAIDFGFFLFKIPEDLREIIERKAGSSKIILGIRPEDLRISNKKRLNAIEAEIDVLELVGKELHVYLTAGDSSIVAITDPMRDLRIGKRAWLVFSREKIHLFDGKSGEAIL